MCTYENWPKATKCAMCKYIPNNLLRPQASSLILSSPEKEIDTTSKPDERYYNNSNILGIIPVSSVPYRVL